VSKEYTDDPPIAAGHSRGQCRGGEADRGRQFTGITIAATARQLGLGGAMASNFRSIACPKLEKSQVRYSENCATASGLPPIAE
jgi:hypothetical protein